jgi:hypothetical protein
MIAMIPSVAAVIVAVCYSLVLKSEKLMEPIMSPIPRDFILAYSKVMKALPWQIMPKKSIKSSFLVISSPFLKCRNLKTVEIASTSKAEYPRKI